MSAAEVCRVIRALPEDGSWCILHGEWLKQAVAQARQEEREGGPR